MLLALALALGVTMVVLACGGGGEKAASSGDTAADGAITFDIIMSDDGATDNFFQFQGQRQPTIRVPPGEEVVFNLTNEGQLPHNMRIAGPDGQYITPDDAVSQPELLQSGDSGTLVWTTPDQPGTFVFQCDVHPAVMVGTITVE